MLRRFLIILISFTTVAFVGFFVAVSDSFAARFYLSPASGSVQNGSNITIDVRLDTEGITTGIADLSLSYDQSKLEFQSYSNTGSPLNTALGLSAGGGSLFVTQYIPPPTTPTGGDILFGRVTFKALTGSGTTTVNVVTAGQKVSLMYSFEDIDGKPVGAPAGGDPLDGLEGRPSTTGTGGTYTLTSPPTPPPPPPPTSGGGTNPPPPPPTSSGGTTTTNPPPASTGTQTETGGSGTDTTVVPNGFGDTTIPTITNIKVSNVTESSATIEWETDEPATSFVDYGTTTAFGNGNGDADYTKEHKVTITFGLEPSTDYSFRVFSSDQAGNTAYSKNQEFRTKPPVSVQRTYRYVGLAMIIGGLLALAIIAFYYFRKKGPHPDNLTSEGPSANLNPPI